MQSTSKAMLEEIRSIRRSLQSNFQDKNDGYTRKMFRFSAVAEDELQEIRDGIVQAEKQLRGVQTYFGEGEEMGRPIQSQDFFGIFWTFTSSWKVSDVRCRIEHQVYGILMRAVLSGSEPSQAGGSG